MPSLDLFPPLFNPKSPIDPAIITKLQNKQHLLFHGYLRSLNIADISDEASHNNHLMYIPSDIITLCYTFFNLHIEILCTAINKSHPAVYAVNYQINHQLTMEEIRDIRQGIKQRFRPDMKQEHLITYDDLYELAMILRGQKDCFIAYELMQCLVEQKADSSEYHNGMGLILKRWNCLEDAEKHYKLAIDGELTASLYNGIRIRLFLKYLRIEAHDHKYLDEIAGLAFDLENGSIADSIENGQVNGFKLDEHNDGSDSYDIV